MNEEIILQLIKEKKYVELKNILSEMNEVDIAEILEDEFLDTGSLLLIFRMLPKDLAVEVFAHFSKEKQRSIISSLNDNEVKHIMDELFFDDMIDMLEEMPANIVKKILLNSSVEERKLINQFLNYPEDSAGSIMTIEYVELKRSMTVKEALDRIRDIGLTKETIYTCYVTDRNRKLEGIITLRTLVSSPDDGIIRDLMDEDTIYAHTHDDQELVAEMFMKYDFIALPVVDMENRLTGIITVDDIMDVMEREDTEDFQIMAAMSPSEDSYLDSKIFKLARQRILWLLILMISATISGAIITSFDELISTVVILTSFIPMLMDTGGNSGSQSSTLIIRGLATGEIDPKDGPKVLWKEFRVALMVGFSLSFINFLRLVMLERVDFNLAILVSVTLIITVIIAKVLGGILPIVAKKLKLDPALMAGPLITTIADASSLLVYFSIASWMFRI